MMSHCFSWRAFFMAAAVSIRSYTGLYPPFFSSRIIRKASSSESSTINTRSDCGLIMLDGVFFFIYLPLCTFYAGNEICEVKKLTTDCHNLLMVLNHSHMNPSS